jgi:hypothetical protein
MSEVKVNKITPRTDCGTTQLGDSGDTVTVTGDLRSNSLKAADGGVIISQSGTTITVGASGDTVSLASGASQSGFGRSGTVDWQTGSIKTGDFTAVNGQGFFVDTNGGAVVATLPAGSAGAIVSFQDYRNTFDTASLTVSPNGSEKINGGAGGVILSTEGEGITLVYIDSTIGWRSIQDNDFANVGSNFIEATGGNTTITCGDFKTHIFTGPGTFAVTKSGTPAGSNVLEYLVVAGGAGSGSPSEGSAYASGGGGGGGFRMFTTAPGSNSPLNAPAGLTASVASFPITVGGAGAFPANGSNSIFSTITSAGGGTGGRDNNNAPTQNHGTAGGSGGGAGGGCGSGGAGNTPPVSPAQGSSGGSSTGGGNTGGGGGGGAGAVGGNASPGTGGAGGVGSYIADSFIGPTAPSYGESGPVSSTRYFAAGGGGGGGYSSGSGTGGNGGDGGGGNGSGVGSGGNGTTNTGGGGGGGKGGTGGATNGSSGIVMIRYKFQ